MGTVHSESIHLSLILHVVKSLFYAIAKPACSKSLHARFELIASDRKEAKRQRNAKHGLRIYGKFVSHYSA
jgi:hypothetical protein